MGKWELHTEYLLGVNGNYIQNFCWEVSKEETT